MADEPAVHGLVVIGGGIMGLMTALLARRRHRELDILLLDRSVLGMGATAYSAYLDLPFSTTALGRELSRRSRELYRELLETVPALPIEHIGLVGVCPDSAQARVLAGLTQPPARSWRGRAITGAPTGFVVPPGHVVFDGIDAMRCVVSGPVAALVSALESTPRTRIMEGADVARVSSHGDLCELALHDGRTLHARRIALCLGPWLAHAPELVSTHGAVRVKKVASLLIPAAPPPGAPVIYLFEHDAFFMPQPERQRWLFSFRSEDWDCGIEPSRLHLNGSDLEQATKILQMHVPTGSFESLGARVFCDGYTVSREPYISALPGLRGVALGGACGSGVRLAPAMAERGLEQIGL
jgi:glycine/D-amino acid oxidase-like deaminating enzyme